MRPFLFRGDDFRVVPAHCRKREDFDRVTSAFVAAWCPQYGPARLEFFRVAMGLLLIAALLIPQLEHTAHGMMCPDLWTLSQDLPDAGDRAALR